MNQSLIPVLSASHYNNQSLTTSPIKLDRKQATNDFSNVFEQIKLANTTKFQLEFQKIHSHSHPHQQSYLKQLAFEEAHHKPRQISVQGAVNLYTANSF